MDIHTLRVHSLTLICLLTAALSAPADSERQATPTAGTAPYAEKTGEVHIRSVLPLTAKERGKLVVLAGVDPEATALLDSKIDEARAYLKMSPQPVAEIFYEGLVHTDSRRIRTVEHLKDADRAAAMLEVWQATGDREMAAHCRLYVSSWASTYRPTGNDVNESKLLPFFVIYESMRDDFKPGQRERIERWMSEIATRQIKAGEDASKRRSNRHTKRLHIVSTIGLALRRVEWRNYSRAGFEEFVTEHLYPDGTSFDLKHRDTLTYHASAIRPLIDLAILAARDGQDLYHWTSSTGSSLKKSVDFVIPFAAGQNVREEWTNSKVILDQQRAAAGLKEYQPGSLYNPARAAPLLEEASFFDSSLFPLVAKLGGAPRARYPTWRMVINDVCRPDSSR